MNESRNTRRSLLSSALCLLLSLVMLTGTTFAWFSDSVRSANNVIKSGTLDLAFERWDGDSWEDATDQQILNYDKWEPGYTQIANLRLVNNGTLALKWNATIKSDGKLTKLADAIYVYAKKDSGDAVKDYIEQNVTRENLDDLTEAGQLTKCTLREYVTNVTTLNSGSLLAGESAYLGLILQMDTAAGNEYQGLDLCKEFDIAVVATQYTYEEDSFDDQYDADAIYKPEAEYIETNGELDFAFDSDGYFVLGNDLNISGSEVMEGKDVYLDLNGLSITTESNILTKGNLEISNGTILGTGNWYAVRTLEGGKSIYENVDIISNGGGVNVFGESVFKSGTVTTNSTTSNARHVFYVATNGDLTIEDGTFKFCPENLSRKGCYIYADGGNVVVYGGTFDKPSTRKTDYPGIKTVNGGTVTVYGGTFRFDPSEYVADGYEAVKNGEWWTVSEK